jgi:hypothetical protein
VLGVSVLVGCAGSGEVVPLQMRSHGAPDSGASKSRGLSIGVLPFEDARSETSRLGVRRHLAGGETYFEVSDGKPGDKIAEVIAEFLRKKGWHAEVVKGSSGGTGKSPSSPTGYDVTLSGKLLDLSANADSGFMKTKISVISKVLVQGLNASDGSTVRMTVSGAGSENVFWFDPEDVEGVLNDVLTESLEKLDADMKVEDKVLRLK